MRGIRAIDEKQAGSDGVFLGLVVRPEDADFVSGRVVDDKATIPMFPRVSREGCNVLQVDHSISMATPVISSASTSFGVTSQQPFRNSSVTG